MPGMFYSLQEAAKKLGKTEAEVRKLAEANKLRLFRDGSNLLFKMDEVNALAATRLDEVETKPAEPGTDIFAEAQLPDTKEPTEEELMLELGDETPAEEPQPAAEADIGSALDLEAEPAAEPSVEPTGEEPTAEMDAEAALDLEAEPHMKEETAPPAEADASSELGLAPEEDQLAAAASDQDLIAAMSEDETAAPAAEQPKEAAEEDEISLTSESSALGAGSDITDMDTALTGEGVNVLAGSGAGEATSGDSSAETVAPAGESTEASLEEIEEDVNLDSFGSGSGLLDLSLQADDTSLGGILDEIYTSEGGGEEGKAAVAAPAHGSVEDISAEADHVTADTTELVSAPEAALPMAAVAATTFMEVPPDKASNLLGGLLFLPLLAILYAAIVAWAALKNARLSIVEPIEGILWYIIGAAIVVTIVVAGIAFTSGREGKPAAVKVKKEKPAQKEKAAQKEAAPAGEAEPAKNEGKPKKSFLSFGKKKK